MLSSLDRLRGQREAEYANVYAWTKLSAFIGVETIALCTSCILVNIYLKVTSRLKYQRSIERLFLSMIVIGGAIKLFAFSIILPDYYRVSNMSA